jgi:outer membrane protein assembly factor BamB
VDDAGNPVPTRMTACGQQRPAINAAPAVATDGTIYLVTRAHRSARTAFVVALNPDLSAKWATSLTGHLGDGCGVTVPADVDGTGALPDGGVHLSHCRIGATLGVDPSTNLPPAGMADDSSSSSPVVLPDGSVLYGALTLYNESRGHLMKFSATGAYQAAYDFGWDETPAVFAHDGTYSILGKDNHYFTYNEDQDGPYFMTRLGPDLSPEWKLQSTNTENCARGDDGGTVCSTETCVPDGDGGTICTPDHPNGFEWCVNAPAIDPSGTAFVNSEDGRLYAINPDGGEREHLFLLESLGAAYTPIALDAQGRIYTLNGGVMTVVGQ